ncbi:MAG: GAF domain-containing SpoIIE family protein phosphatase [Planctomycetota bacterium]
MLLAPVIETEKERLQELRSLNLLDTPPEERFDRLVRLARSIFKVPVAYIALVDSERQWFKAKCGIAASETGRDVSFCSHTVARNKPLIIDDALEDKRFVDNPLVTGEPFVRFYAGYPLKGPDGNNIGTLCLVDSKPRKMSEHELSIFRDLAVAVEHELQMVDVIETQRELLVARQELDRAQEQIEGELLKAARYVHEQIPEKLKTDHFDVDWAFQASNMLGGDLFGYFPLSEDEWAFYLLDVAGHGVGSSLLAVTVHHELQNRTLKDTDYSNPADVLMSLNRAFPMEQHQNKFFTIWYGIYNTKSRELTYSSGGHHPSILTACGSGESHSLGEPGFVIGMSEVAEYSNSSVQVPPDSRLYVFSDGVYEVHSKQDEFLGYEGLQKNLLQACPITADRVNLVLDYVTDWAGEPSLDDDFSLLEVSFK